MVRTPPPQAYEKTITNYFAFKVRGPQQKNAQFHFSPPEPGACSLDGHLNSIRGWVVPVVYETRTGELTGRETIRINARPYFFWFLGNTIAGVTPRLESCPGVGSSFAAGERPGDALDGVQRVAFPVAPPPAEAAPRSVEVSLPPAADRAQPRAQAPRAQKAITTKKKTGRPPAKARSAAKSRASD